MPETKRPLKVFVSYASQDKPVVRELSGRLAREGWIDPWVDEKKLLPGQDWRLKIEEAVETADIVIICLSTNSVSKEGFVQKELRYAREIAFEKPEETIFLIPLRLDDCSVPRGLRFYQWGDYFGEEKDETYRALLEALKLRYEQKLRLEEEEGTRKEKEKLEREAAEKVAREKVKQDAVERIAKEKEEKEFVEKVKREKAEREIAEIAAREKVEREFDEKSKHQKMERQVARKVEFERVVSKSFTTLKSTLASATPFFRIVGVAGIFIIFFWGGSLAIPQLLSLIPTAKSSVTVTSTKAFVLTATKTKAPTLTLTPTFTPVPQSAILLQEDFEDGIANGWDSNYYRNNPNSWVIEKDVDGNHYWSGSGHDNYPQIWYGDQSLGWTDYAFESRIKFFTEGTLFICVRTDSGRAFYTVYIDNISVNYAQKGPSSEWTGLGTKASKTFTTNKWYTVRVEIKGSLLSTYIDNVPIRKYELPSPTINTQGGIGYYMGGGEKFYIDDIKVWSLK